MCIGSDIELLYFEDPFPKLCRFQISTVKLEVRSLDTPEWLLVRDNIPLHWLVGVIAQAGVLGWELGSRVVVFVLLVADAFG